MLLRFLDFASIAAMEASSRRIRELVREREVMKRAVQRRYGMKGRRRQRRRGGGDDDGGGGDEEEDEEEEIEPPLAPGEAPRQPVQGLPLIDNAPCLKGSSLMWKRLGLAFSSGFEKGKSPAAASSSLSLVADDLAASSTDQPEEHVSNVLTPRSHPRRRWEAAAYWSSRGSARPEEGGGEGGGDEALSFRLAHPLCVATAVTIAPFEAFFQPGRPVYAPRSVRLASGRSDCWGEPLVREWEERQRQVQGQQGQQRRRRRWWSWGRNADDEAADDDNADNGAGEEEEEEREGGAFPTHLERFIDVDSRGLSEARTRALIDEERRRVHPRGYPRFDGSFLRDNIGGNGESDGSGWAAVSRRLPVRKSGTAQRLSLIGREGGEEGEEEEEELEEERENRQRRRQRQRQRQSATSSPFSPSSSPPASPSSSASSPALLVTGGHARLLLLGRTQTQDHVDDMFYTCLSYVGVDGFAVRGLRVEFRLEEGGAAARRFDENGGGGGESDDGGSAAAAAAAAALPPPPPRQRQRCLIPVLTRIPEGRDPLFEVIPRGLSAVSERGRAASRARRRRRALSTAEALFSLPPSELSDESAVGTRRLAEALLAAADDSESDGDELWRGGGNGGEEGEEEDEDEEEEEERGEGEREFQSEAVADAAAVAAVAAPGVSAAAAAKAKARLVSGMLLPDGAAFPPAAAMRMVRMLAVGFAAHA